MTTGKERWSIVINIIKWKMLKYYLENTDIYFGENKFTLLCDKEKNCIRLNKNILLGHHMAEISVHLETHLH